MNEYLFKDRSFFDFNNNKYTYSVFLQFMTKKLKVIPEIQPNKYSSALFF
jgi:hypothetical protein